MIESMNQQDIEEFAELFKRLREKQFDILFYDLKTRGFTIKEMYTKPTLTFSGYEQQPYTITVRFQNKNCEEGLITFYGAFPKECRSIAMKDYQILSFNTNVRIKKVDLID